MRLFDSPCQPGIYLPRKMKVEPYLSLERDWVIGKIRVLAKSRNPCKLFSFDWSAWFLYFLAYVSKHVTSLVIWKKKLQKASNSSSKLSFFIIYFAYQRSLFIKHGLNTRLNVNKTSCIRGCIHIRLSVVSCITVFIVSLNANTVNSLYSGHCRDLESMSSLARVRNSGSLFQSSFCNLFLPGI